MRTSTRNLISFEGRSTSIIWERKKTQHKSSKSFTNRTSPKLTDKKQEKTNGREEIERSEGCRAASGSEARVWRGNPRWSAWEKGCREQAWPTGEEIASLDLPEPRRRLPLLPPCSRCFYSPPLLSVSRTVERRGALSFLLLSFPSEFAERRSAGAQGRRSDRRSRLDSGRFKRLVRNLSMERAYSR